MLRYQHVQSLCKEAEVFILFSSRLRKLRRRRWKKLDLQAVPLDQQTGPFDDPRTGLFQSVHQYEIERVFRRTLSQNFGY
jgi:hypothetical protein